MPLGVVILDIVDPGEQVSQSEQKAQGIHLSTQKVWSSACFLLLQLLHQGLLDPALWGSAPKNQPFVNFF